MADAETLTEAFCHEESYILHDEQHVLHAQAHGFHIRC